MTDEDIFGGDFASFEDFMKGLKPGEHRPLSGILRYRQGSDPINWTQSGAQKYIPGAWQMMAGNIAWTGAAATSGVKEFNFAVKFAHYPLFWITVDSTWPLFEDIRCMGSLASNRTLEIWWWSTNPLTSCTFNWLAIGPVGP